MTEESSLRGCPTIVLIGLMGAGKTTIGQHLSKLLGMPFIDSDAEIVKAAGCSVQDIFDLYGEPAFRDLERRVITRILDGGSLILATGGGAFMDPQTRERIKSKAFSVWLRADLEVLDERTARRDNRPLLRQNRRQTLQRLMEERYPVYAQADAVVDSGDEPLENTAQRVIGAMQAAMPANPSLEEARS